MSPSPPLNIIGMNNTYWENKRDNILKTQKKFKLKNIIFIYLLYI